MDKKLTILGIETSCDETALALVEASGPFRQDKNEAKKNPPTFNVLKNVIASQIKIHKKYGGVVPGLAKREHQKNLIPTLQKVLKLSSSKFQVSSFKLQAIDNILHRYPELLKNFKIKIATRDKPLIDLIAVTHGPGLEPALWVGVNFARALSVLWDIPIIGIDHMEGHVAVNLLNTDYSPIKFPAIALAVSGGHTQLILVKNWMEYELLGETLDDAAGEAFDKVARMLKLPFPGGPHIEKLGKKGDPRKFDLPRPMEKSGDYNFSFSGLKTAVRYTLEKLNKKEIQTQKADMAASFQQAIVDVLISKTIKAAKEYNTKTIMLAGGVAANQKLKKELQEEIKRELPDAQYLVPQIKLATDNGVMIAIAGYLRYQNGYVSDWKVLEANSNKLITEN